MVNAGDFQMYDYGSKSENQQKYHQVNNHYDCVYMYIIHVIINTYKYMYIIHTCNYKYMYIIIVCFVRVCW